MLWFPLSRFKRHRPQQVRPQQVDGLAEHCDARTLRGWAYRPAQPNIPVTVELWVGSQPVQTVKADLPRDDIAARLGTRGRHGFAFRLDEIGLGEHDIRDDARLTVKLAHTNAKLPSAGRLHRPSHFTYGKMRYGAFAFERGLATGNRLFEPADHPGAPPPCEGRTVLTHPRQAQGAGRGARR